MEKQYKPFEIEITTLGYYINRAFCSLVKLLNKQLRENGLKFQHSEFTILKMLDTLKGASQTQLADVLGKERSGIGRSVASLEKKGYVKKEALNGSTNYVTLTKKGEDVIPLINNIIEKVSGQAFKGFSQKSRVSMLNNLTKIYQNSLPD